MALKRTLNTMPEGIRASLVARGLMSAYESRPAYQQNDYLGSLCVVRARREETRQKRLEQMLEELEGGTKYMNMKWRAK